MHETLLSSVKGYIDFVKYNEFTTSVRGWCLSADVTTPLNLRIVSDSIEIPIVTEVRDDVAAVYKTETDRSIGWNAIVPKNTNVELQVFEDNADEKYTEWKTVFILTKRVNTTLAKPQPPTFLVVDNVYDSPDDVRRFALACNLKEHSAFHKGKRTDEVYRFPGLKERFEQIIGYKIVNWETYGTNGCFQYCIGGDQLVYHNDTQQYAGVLYLTPDAPVASGTNLYRSKHTKSMDGFTADYKKTYPTGHLDPTQFELVDVVGNVYNRLILFNSHMIHAASTYFGDCKENGRLFQLFFFDLDKGR